MVIKEVSRSVTLPDYIQAYLSMPFAWGTNDCVTFALNWIYKSTGVDYKSQLQLWTNEDEATLAIASVGGIKAQCDKWFKQVNPLCAMDGDIALIARTVYVFSGPNLVAPGLNGLVFDDRMRAKCAWSFR